MKIAATMVASTRLATVPARRWPGLGMLSATAAVCGQGVDAKRSFGGRAGTFGKHGCWLQPVQPAGCAQPALGFDLWSMDQHAALGMGMGWHAADFATESSSRLLRL